MSTKVTSLPKTIQEKAIKMTTDGIIDVLIRTYSVVSVTEYPTFLDFALAVRYRMTPEEFCSLRTFSEGEKGVEE